MSDSKRKGEGTYMLTPEQVSGYQQMVLTVSESNDEIKRLQERIQEISEQNSGMQRNYFEAVFKEHGVEGIDEFAASIETGEDGSMSMRVYRPEDCSCMTCTLQRLAEGIRSGASPDADSGGGSKTVH